MTAKKARRLYKSVLHREWLAFCDANPGADAWYRNLKIFQIYPQSLYGDGKVGMWKSCQCDGCYELIKPTDVVWEWVMAHYRHRHDVLKEIPFPKGVSRGVPELDGGGWDTTSTHIRWIQIAELNA